MTLDTVAVMLFLALCGMLLWQHLEIGQRAYRAAKQRTEEVGVVLLDQSIVLRSIALRRSHRSLFAFERRYDFEFCSIGDVRYPGQVVFVGKRQQSVRLAPFRTEQQLEPLDSRQGPWGQ